jgi:hypothetical protein
VVALEISATPNLITPVLDRKMKDNMARKSGYKQVHGDLYKRRTHWKRFCDFISSSRALNVVGKAHFESKQYVEAALLRKDHQAEQSGLDLTSTGHEDKVWNSNGVQNRLMREDRIRYGENFYIDDKKNSGRNVWAKRFSNLSHLLHGVTEMFAAPTGMTYNVMRNTLAGKPDEKGTQNKIMMFGFLGFIGVGTTELLNVIRGATADFASLLGQSVVGLLVAFPAVSSTLGLLGFASGVVSQTLVQKEKVGEEQQKYIVGGLSKNLQKLLSQLKSIKGNPELIHIMAKAMQGKYHLIPKIRGKDSLDPNGVPVILNNVLNAINLDSDDVTNLKAMKNALGEYLQVEKPPKEGATLWSRYKYAKAVTNKERHYVALISVVDHMEVENLRADELQDARRYTEEKTAVRLHDLILKTLAAPATLIDRLANTTIAPTLRKWASENYRKQKMADIGKAQRASKNCFKGEYMAKNIHQYRPVTRALIKIAEGMRLINMNIILASNANLSRIFNNAALLIHNTFGTSPASRSMCNSLGRFFGGAVLAIIFGTFIPAAADATGSPATVSTNGKLPVDFTMTNIGILMFLLSAPTLMVQGLAHLAARVEGWEGNIAKSLPPGADHFKFSR